MSTQINVRFKEERIVRRVILIMFLSFVLGVAAIAEKRSNEDVPPGMEIITINNVRYLVPKGTKIHKRGGVFVLEGQSEYMAKRFDIIDKHLESIKEKEKGLSFEVEQLKKTVEKLQKSNEKLQSDFISFMETSK